MFLALSSEEPSPSAAIFALHTQWEEGMEGGHQTGGQKKRTDMVERWSPGLTSSGGLGSVCLCVVHKLLGNTVNKQEEVTEQLLDLVLESLMMLFLISSHPPIIFL